MTSLPYSRYPAYESPESSYRTRSRWQAPDEPEPPSTSYDDYPKGNDKPRFDLGR